MEGGNRDDKHGCNQLHGVTLDRRLHTASVAMGQFSDDGQWWWDGSNWVATAQVVIPQLPPTEFEQSGRAAEARRRAKKGAGRAWVTYFPPIAILGVVALADVLPALGDYRSWKLEQMALATIYLLGPDEPMLAGEVATVSKDPPAPVLAVAVTSAHVIVFRLDSLEGQPQWILLAGRASDVSMNVRTGIEKLLLLPALLVTGRNGQLVIGGLPIMFKPEPVLDAWRQAGGAAPNP